MAASNFNKETLLKIINSLIEDSFTKLGADIAHSLLLAEIQYLYANKIYDEQGTHNVIPEIFVDQIDQTLLKSCQLLSKDLERIVEQIGVKLRSLQTQDDE